MFMIQLANNEYYASKRGRVQHFKSIEKADAKIQKLGEIAAVAIVIECKAKTAASPKEETKTVSEIKAPKVIKTKKATSKPEKPASSKTKKSKA